MVTSAMLDAEVTFQMPACKFCQSKDAVKNGTRNGVQYWLCKACGHGFVDNQGLPKMRYPVDTIAKATYDYYAGTSLNKIRQGIADQWHTHPSDSAIYGWLRLLTEAALNKAKKYHPQVGEKWIADETVVWLNGKKYWLIDVISADTRFLLATKLSTNRGTKDIVTALETAKERANKSPKFLVTDGWGCYPSAIEQVFGADTRHLIGTPFEHRELTTSLIERWHGTLKDRLKPMRGMDKSQYTQLVLDGFVFYYNYFRPHESLDGRTPAEVAKIKFPFKSWQDVAKSLAPPVPKLINPSISKLPAKEALYILHHPKPYRKRPKPKRTIKKQLSKQTVSEIGRTR